MDFHQIVAAIELDAEIQFHLLRHFKTVDKEYWEKIKVLSNKDGEELRKQMDLPGSKFIYSFASNPLELWSKVKLKLKETNSNPKWLNDSCELFLMYDKNEEPKSIGISGIINRKNLDDEDKKNIFFIERDGYKISSIKINQIQLTWQLNLILSKKNESISIKTIFPGILAPPFPNNKIQNEIEFRKNKLFWDENILIKY